jgi:GntR family transcriptional regulator
MSRMSLGSQTRLARVPIPRYAEVEENLRDSIVGGRYQVGSQLPSETELAEQFKVSRFTIREALRMLSASGMITRQQGARSRVIRTEETTGYTFSVGSAEDLQQYASQTYFDIASTSLIKASPSSLARFLRCRDNKEWLLLKGARRDTATSLVLGYTEVYLWRQFESHLAEITKRGEPIHKQIEATLGIQAGDIVQDISAIAMPEEAAEAIGVPPGSPALEIVRHYSGSRGRSFEVARNVHPATRFTYSQVFHRQLAPGAP